MSADAIPPVDGDALLAAHYLPVMRLCLSRLHDQSDAEDATQETFRRAVQKAPALHDDPLPWLLTVARNVCTDELRRRSRLAGLTAPDDSAAPAADPTPEGVVLGRLGAVELLGRLTPGERRAVAARMGALAADSPATSTTRVLLARARDKVRRYLEDAQGAFGTATVYTTEALHTLRTRFAGRTLIGSGRAAMLVPAMLIIGVVGGPASNPAVLAPAPPRSSAPSAVVPGPGDALRAHMGAMPGGHSVLDNVGAALTAGSLPGAGQDQIQLPPRHGGALGNLPVDDYTQVDTTDVEPSPYYGTDHTVMMIGYDHTCQAPSCTQIYRSSDGGATWTAGSQLTVLGAQLVLPPAFSQGTYYVIGPSGVEMTRNNGTTFTTVVPGVNGAAVVPPASSGFDMIYSNENALWGVYHDGTPTVLSLFQQGMQASGSPALLTSPTGFTVLQPVIAATPSPPPYLESCTPQCGTPALLPTMGAPHLRPSPEIATDHTIFAIEPGLDLAVSHDDGATFSVIPNASVEDMTVTEGPHGLRLVASMAPSFTLGYSDDEGRTWQTAALPSTQLFLAHSVTRLRAGRLIASLERRDAYLWYDFVCSTDGSAWTSCTPDKG